MRLRVSSSTDGEVVHLSEGVGRYLRHAGGRPTTQLLEMVGGELRLQLRTLLRGALRSGSAGEAHGVRVDVDGGHRRLDVSVRPMPGADPERPFLLVVFDEQPASRTAPPPRSQGAAERAAESDRVASLEQLEAELKETAAQLAATSEEHEATIEELRASNEELQATGEEQRAVAEELEASKEELQSINEELLTINQEHRIRNEELARVNSDLINLIDSTDIGTVFLDRDLRIRRFTPPVADVFNFLPADVGRPISHVTNRLLYRGMEEDMREVMTSLGRIEREVTTGDDRWYVVRLSPYRSVDDTIDGVVLTLVDTTARKVAELDREALLERVGEASAAKSNFISAMSHEFRTPLNAILGYAGLLREGAAGPLTEDQLGKLARISVNARHLEQMISEILAVARGDAVGAPLDCRPVELASLVRDVAGSVESLAGAKRIALSVEAPEQPTTIVTDSTKLQRILVNLLGNAIRYTDEGEVRLRACIDGASVVIEVEDTGIGIAPEHLERIFERFWQVDQGHTRVRGGTGLGLMVSRELARALGGDIEVESMPGEGSLFRLRLPADCTRRCGESTSSAKV
jgi:two-component system, chemotaxis family, CheB/CheR fusion protein